MEDFTDAAAHAVIPSMPSYSPHIPIYRHLRHIMPLISADAYGETYFQTYVDAVEQARYSDRELSQDEFEMTMEAKSAIEEMSVFISVARIWSLMLNF